MSWLGTYVHLLDADLGAPVDVARVNTGSTQRPETAAKALTGEALEVAA
jgi:hypothetical protein